MEEFILSGQAMDLVLLVIAVEFVGLLFLRRKSWRRAGPDHQPAEEAARGQDQ